MLVPELLKQPADDTLIEVVAAQMIVAGRGQDLNRIAVDIQNTDVEGASAQIVDHDLTGLPFVKPVGKGGGGRFVNDSQDIQPGNEPRVLGGLTLGIREIGRHGNDRVGDGFPDIVFRVRLELLQDHGGDFLRGILLPVNTETPVRTHVSLDGGEGAGGIGDGLPLGGHADKTLSGFGEGDDGRRGPPAFGIRNDNSPAVFHKGDAGIGGSQVNPDQFRHNIQPPGFFRLPSS